MALLVPRKERKNVLERPNLIKFVYIFIVEHYKKLRPLVSGDLPV